MNRKLLQSLAVATFTTILTNGNLIAMNELDAALEAINTREQNCFANCHEKYKEEFKKAPSGSNPQKDAAAQMLKDCKFDCGSVALSEEAHERMKGSGPWPSVKDGRVVP